MCEQLTKDEGVKRANLTLLLLGAIYLIYSGAGAISGLLAYAVAIPCVVLLARHMGVDLPMHKPAAKTLFQSVGIVICAMPFASLLVLIMTYITGSDTGYAINDSFLYDVMIYAILPPITEELAVRGLLFGAYNKVSTRYAILLSSVAFAIVHMSYTNIPYALMYGLLFAIVRAATGNLVYTIVMHFAFNFINVVIMHFFPDANMTVMFVLFILVICNNLLCTLIWAVVKDGPSIWDKGEARFIDFVKPASVITTVVFVGLVVWYNVVK